MKELKLDMTSIRFAIRDRIALPAEVLTEADLRPGDRVVDFGCGPGGYTLAAALAVGPKGRVIAVDKNPLALQRVLKLAEREGLANIVTMQTDGTLDLADGSVDRVLLYDTFHGLDDPRCVLAEVHRVLKGGALLSFSDPILDEAEILDGVTAGRRFELSIRATRTYAFAKAAG